MNSRYYNPEWGRFINADGITGKTGELLSHNMFAYCRNNPINSYDPNGYYQAVLNGVHDSQNIGPGFLDVIALTIMTISVALNPPQISYTSKSITDTRDSKVTPIANDITEPKQPNYTKLYRSMDYVEYGRTMKFKQFTNYSPGRPEIMDNKWFATNVIDAHKWGSKLNPNGYKIVEVTVPTQALKCMYFNPFLDGIGPAYACMPQYINSVKINLRGVY